MWVFVLPWTDLAETRKAGSCERVTERDGSTKGEGLRHCHHLTNDYVPRSSQSFPFHSIPFRAFSYSNSNFLTKCTHTIQYLYCSLNVITQHTTTHRTQEQHIHRTVSLIRIIKLTPAVGTEKEHILTTTLWSNLRGRLPFTTNKCQTRCRQGT